MDKQRRTRQQEAEVRKVAREARTPEQQMCLIKTRRGDSKKETARLEKLISAQKAEKKEQK